MASNSEVEEVIQTIARQLGETEPAPLYVIRQAVERLGPERCLAMTRKALAIQARGGLWTDDRSRRRTTGGVFFKLIRSLPRSEWRPIMTPPWEEHPWMARQALRLTARGELRVVKIVVVGRPGKPIEMGSSVLVSLTMNRLPRDLPRDLPRPPDMATHFLVYVIRRHWQQVEAALREDPEDVMVAQGYPFPDPERRAIVVLALHTTTRKLQARQREQRARERSGRGRR